MFLVCPEKKEKPKERDWEAWNENNKIMGRLLMGLEQRKHPGNSDFANESTKLLESEKTHSLMDPGVLGLVTKGSH